MHKLDFIPRPVLSLLVFPLMVGAALAGASNSSKDGGFASASASPAQWGPVSVAEPGNEAPAPFSLDELFERARESAGRMDKALQQFVCREQIERFRGSTGSEQHRKIDVISSVVSYDSGEEHYTEILQNDKHLVRIAGMKGAWSEGEYGTFLREAITIFRSKPVRFLSMNLIEGQRAAAYAFDVSSDESPWDIQVSGKHYRLPFRGQVWVSPTTGRILQVDRISTRPPRETGISGVNWSVSFGEMQVDGKRWWLPAKAVYSVTYLRSNRHEWNKIAFSGYRRYGSEVAVYFE